MDKELNSLYTEMSVVFDVQIFDRIVNIGFTSNCVTIQHKLVKLASGFGHLIL